MSTANDTKTAKVCVVHINYDGNGEDRNTLKYALYKYRLVITSNDTVPKDVEDYLDRIDCANTLAFGSYEVKESKNVKRPPNTTFTTRIMDGVKYIFCQDEGEDEDEEYPQLCHSEDEPKEVDESQKSKTCIGHKDDKDPCMMIALKDKDFCGRHMGQAKVSDEVCTNCNGTEKVGDARCEICVCPECNVGGVRAETHKCPVVEAYLAKFKETRDRVSALKITVEIPVLEASGQL